MVKVKQDKEEVLQEIEDQAEINLKHRPELQKGWEELQAKHIELQAVKTKFDKLHQKQMSFLEVGTPSLGSSVPHTYDF